MSQPRLESPQKKTQRDSYGENVWELLETGLDKEFRAFMKEIRKKHVLAAGTRESNLFGGLWVGSA